MLLSDFDYALPDSLIARYPAAARRDSRLLVLGERLQDRCFAELGQCLAAGDLLVLNDTRVIRARLRGQKSSGGKIEILVERILDDRQVLAQVRASKSPQAGGTMLLDGGCEVRVAGREDNLYRLAFSQPAAEYLEQFGEMPLPPYLDRAEESADAERYQTIYARQPGAVAAPTAGLHFDEALLEELDAAGIRHVFVTLHVGAGTFQPLRHEKAEANRLHSERVIVDETVCTAVRETRAAGGRVVAVGTTSVRALEAASNDTDIAPFDGETNLFIMPGYRFQSVDALLTNFHLPRSSLLMLVAAFAGRERVLDAYRHAVENRYRFFSYGDAMLAFPNAT